MEKGDVTVFFQNVHRGEAHSWSVVRQTRERLEVRGEERSCAHAVVQILQHGSGNRVPVLRTRPASDLVEHDETTMGCVTQDVGGLGHLTHEGADAVGQIVIGANTCEQPIYDTDARAHGRYKGSGLRHQHDQGDLPQIGRLTRHIGSGEHQHVPDTLAGCSVVACSQACVVGREFAPFQRGFDQRVAAGLDLQHRIVRELWAHIPPDGRHFHESEPDVQLSEGGCRGAQLRMIGRDRAEQLGVQLALQRRDLFARDLYARLMLFEGWRAVALSSGQGLAALVLRGDAAQVGPRDLNAVAKDLVVRDTQRLDACSLSLRRFQMGQPLPRARYGVFQRIQGSAMAAPDHSALLIERRERLLNERRRLATGIEAFAQPHQGTHGQRLQRFADGSDARETCRERLRVARACHALQYASDQALKIWDTVEQRADHLPQFRVRVQRCDGVQAVLHQATVGQGMEESTTKQTRTHRGTCRVEHPEQGRSLRSATRGLNHFQGRPGAPVNLDEPIGMIGSERCDQSFKRRVHGMQVRQQRAGAGGR